MSETVVESLEPDPAAAAEGPTEGPSLLVRLLRQPVGFACIAWLTLVVFVALFGRWITPHNPEATDPRNAMVAPFDGTYWLGTDDAGRDVLSRLIVATQTNMFAVFITLFISILVGVTAGLIAGYFLGWFDQVSEWVSNLIMAMPGIVLLVAAKTVIGPSILWAMAIFGLLIAPSFYRLVNQTVRGVRNELYVDAARVSGISDGRIIRRHILRVVRGPIIIQAAIISSVSIAILAGLALIGFAEVGSATWGSMLQAGFQRIFRTRWLVLWPALVISLTSLAFALLGSLLRDELEGGVRSKKRRKKNDTNPGAVSAEITDGNGEGPTSLHPTMLAKGGSVADEIPTIEHQLPEPIDPLLSVRNLVVGYPDDSPEGFVHVVREVSLDVGRGEVLGLVGESGSGKSQTAFAVMGLLGFGGQILDGSVKFDGEELVGRGEAIDKLRGTRMAYVPQEPMSNLDPTFTIGSQLVEPLRACLKMDKAAAKKKAIELLDKVHIPQPERVVDLYPHQVSGGMAQRVLIAGAVAAEPDLIIADEPTTALDVTVQAEILDLLRELQRDMGTALLLVTHNFGVVADIADRVAVMQYGRIVETGPVRDIFHQAEHPYTLSLMDAILDNHPARPRYEEVSS